MDDELDEIEVSEEQIIADLAKIQDNLGQLAGRVFAEIEDHDATEGRDYHLMSIWAELRNQRDKVLQVKFLVKNSYLI
jgi:hypothetical protein